MRIEGRVLEIMESMPLQLEVESGSERIAVGLQSETTVTKSGSSVDPGSLRPHDLVLIEGPASGHAAMMADSIVILN